MAKESARDLVGAEQAYRKAIDLAPDRADYRFTLGDFLQVQRRHKEAAASFAKATELGPADALTYFRLGECLQSVGDKIGAIEAFRKALVHDPNMAAARQQLDKMSGD